jgi:hypothetical protein
VSIGIKFEDRLQSITGGVPEDAPPHILHLGTSGQTEIDCSRAIYIQNQQVVLNRLGAVQADALDDITHTRNGL